MPTPIARLLTKPVTLHSRSASGAEDAWGSPVITETALQTMCYYRLARTGDNDRGDGATTVWENYEIFLPANTAIEPYDAVTLDGLKLEVVGRPDPEWNARTGEVNHVKLLARRAAP